MQGLAGIFDGRSGREDRGACDVAEGKRVAAASATGRRSGARRPAT